MAIQSFADKETQQFFINGTQPKKTGWSQVASVALRKLDLVHFARSLSDLKSPPGNKLEALKNDLAGFYSIRVNAQWRIVFRWTEKGPSEVKVCDYH